MACKTVRERENNSGEKGQALKVELPDVGWEKLGYES
jgi:hypothetical protein